MQYDVPGTGGRSRLTRSTRDKMWTGVAGGMADYFDVDSVLVRLAWVVGTLVTGGLAVPIYLVLWWLTPRAEASTVAPWAPPPGDAVAAGPFDTGAATARADGDGAPTEVPIGTAAYESMAPPGDAAYGGAPPAPPPLDPPSPPDAPPRRPALPPEEYRRRRQKTAGVILILLGLFFLAGQLDIFSWYAWRYFWPVLLIAVGVMLLARQGRGWRRF